MIKLQCDHQVIEGSCVGPATEPIIETACKSLPLDGLWMYGVTVSRAVAIRGYRNKTGFRLGLYFLLLCFNVQGTNRGPTDRVQHIKKH